ncbi:hypothetical protein NDU88_010727 [Pleurodeles waltl]|uniref:Uncharacterized protein n=1 Tax=Pleurodeles waltl TaxID=8319 RepID=A0AAV7RZ13_PLEWA|nr:hypothetical protein NDU88_010727 [Pleurodeles waltl]
MTVAGTTTTEETGRRPRGTFQSKESETSEHFWGHSDAQDIGGEEANGVEMREAERERGEERQREEAGEPQKQEEDGEKVTPRRSKRRGEVTRENRRIERAELTEEDQE